MGRGMPSMLFPASTFLAALKDKDFYCESAQQRFSPGSCTRTRRSVSVFMCWWLEVTWVIPTYSLRSPLHYRGIMAVGMWESWLYSQLSGSGSAGANEPSQASALKRLVGILLGGELFWFTECPRVSPRCLYLPLCWIFIPWEAGGAPLAPLHVVVICFSAPLPACKHVPALYSESQNPVVGAGWTAGRRRGRISLAVLLLVAPPPGVLLERGPHQLMAERPPSFRPFHGFLYEETNLN